MIVEHDAPVESAETEENYFVSMTDMMVGILFIFIIMLMAFALDFRTQTDVQEDAIEVAREVARQLESLQAEVRDGIAALDEAQETRRRLLRDIRDQLRAQGLDVQIDEANGVLRLTEEAIRFEPDQSELVGKARENVGKVARVLSIVLPRYTSCRRLTSEEVACKPGGGSTVETVFVEGHTDVTGSDHRNWQLSTERAVNTYREMIVVAPDLRSLANRHKEEILSVSGYSSTRPIERANTRDAWTVNRRIDLRFVMEIDSRQQLKEILKLTDDMKVQIDRLMLASGAR